MSWWRRNWRVGIVLIIAALALIVGIILYVCWKRDEVEELRMEMDLLKAGAKVKGLEADKKVLGGKLEANDVINTKLDDEILEAKKAAVAVVKRVETMSEDEISEEFRKLGY